MNIILFKFHEQFQGLIGFEDISNLKIHLDFENQIIYNNFQLPFYFNIRSKNYHINEQESRLIEIPVNFPSEDIYIPDIKTNDYYIPACETTSKNNLAKVELRNISHGPINFSLLEPIKAFSLNNFDTFSYKIKPTP